jgi:hypothetical protein
VNDVADQANTAGAAVPDPMLPAASAASHGLPGVSIHWDADARVWRVSGPDGRLLRDRLGRLYGSDSFAEAWQRRPLGPVRTGGWR